MSAGGELKPEELRRICDAGTFSFKSTEELDALEEIIGQERALRSVSFGIEIRSRGYHMYALGPTGTGKTTTLRKFLEKEARERPTPDDWLYVNNFEDSDAPGTIRLPAGKGREFKDDMDRLVEELRTEVPKAFEGNEYQQEKEKIEQEVQSRGREMFEELQQEARDRGLRLLQTPQGLGAFPTSNGDIMTPDQMEELEDEERQEIEEKQQEFRQKLLQVNRRIQDLQKQGRERTRELDKRYVGFAVDHLINELKETYSDYPQVVSFLEKARSYLLEHSEAFKQIKQMEEAEPQQRAAMSLFGGGQPSFEEYRVNLLVDNGKTEGAPMVHEKHPTSPNLVGRIEHQGRLGTLVTSFQMIKPGSLHRANGGYLLVDAFDALTKPMAWEELKRALKNEEITIESPGEAFGVLMTRTLNPEPIPLEIKVVLIGDPFLYYLLYHLDPDFQELFKVKADFQLRMEWNEETVQQYARFIGTICREEGLEHFDPSGAAALVENGARLADHQGKLGTRFGEVVDLIRQSSYWAWKAGSDLVRGEDVEKALEEKVYRANRVEERIREMIEEQTLLIDTDGEVVGQVNGISVVPLGDYSFGRPSRITSRTGVGTAGVVHIDREAELGGKLHNKGAMTLGGYLSGRYAWDVPLALSATIAFEQLYEEIEGDSAASAELYALLSSLSGFPLRQGIAVTGSVNQRGEVQAIGGVNEKVEGFFRVCRARGLTGDQGVVIPESNRRHLMLHREVVEAVRGGTFHVYTVSHVDQAMELLTGQSAGEPDGTGVFPEGSVNRAIQDRIRGLAEKAREYRSGRVGPGPEGS
jgi:lon-related putative ATP-dependent protease